LTVLPSGTVTNASPGLRASTGMLAAASVNAMAGTATTSSSAS
jgi:hypothetical protein